MFTHENCPISPTRSSPINGQNLELFGNNYQSRLIVRNKNKSERKIEIIFFSMLNHHYNRTFILSWIETRLFLYTYAHVCDAVVHHGRCPSPSAPEEFNRKSIKVTRQLVVARLCTGAIVKAKPVILYIRQREPTPNQYPLWYTDVYRKRSATTTEVICDPGFVARATIEISLFDIILSAHVWRLMLELMDEVGNSQIRSLC